VACTSVKDCWALGYQAAPLTPTVTGYLMAIHWNGSAWKVVWTTAPYYGADSSVGLRAAVCCTSTNNCWGSGILASPRSTTTDLGALERLEVGAKPPKITNSSLYGVDCSSARDCWAAVGNVGVGTFSAGTNSLALHWNGSQWTPVTTPSGQGSPSDVTCSSSTDRWAVGNVDSSNGNLNFALRWNGSTWSPF